MSRPVITVDPRQRFGQPCVGLTPTHIAASSVRGGMTFTEVAEDLDLTVHQVVLACWFEAQPGQQYHEVWRDWAVAVTPALSRPGPLDVDAVPEPPQRGGVDE